MLVVIAQCTVNVYSEQLPAHAARERFYHVKHYRLNIDINLQSKTCSGDVTLIVQPLRPHLDSLVVDAAGLNIHRATINGNMAEFRNDSAALHIALDKEYSLTDTMRLQINYDVQSPEKGLYFIAPDSGYPNKQYQAWSQGQPEDNHYWFPCYDYPNDKSTSEMIVTVNDAYAAISNGALMDVKRNTKEHTATYHWYQHKPISSYLISLVVGEYAQIKENCKGLPLSYNVYPGEKDKAALSFGKTCDAIQFFSSTIGFQFPWEKYAQTVVQDFMYAGMENASATTLTDGTIHDERAHLYMNSDGLMAHELAHQWWGDCVTPRDWSHAWLSEGFASYFDLLFQEHDKGRETMDRALLDIQRGLVLSDAGENRRPTVCNRYVNPSDIYDNRIYGKGAAILHMLRFTLGDELFWKSIHQYVEKYQFGLVETNDFKLAIEDASGYNLRKFFDQWVYHAGVPELSVQARWDSGSHSEIVSVKQLQLVDSLTTLFELPVDIQIWVNEKPETYRVTIAKQEEHFSFPSEVKPQLVLFDKGNIVLKQVEFDKEPSEWVFQLQHADAAIDRMLAADALRWSIDDDSILSALSNVTVTDPSWIVRQTGAYILGRSKKRETQNVLIQMYGDVDARVRSAAISALGNFETEESRKAIIYALNNDLSYDVVAAALRSLASTDPEHSKEYCDSALNRDSYHEILRSTALNIIAEEDSVSYERIKQYTRYGISPDVRAEALNILCRTWARKDEIIDYIISLLNDPSFHIKRTVLSLLGSYGSERVINILQHSADTETDSRLAKLAREAIHTIEQRSTKEQK